MQGAGVNRATSQDALEKKTLNHKSPTSMPIGAAGPGRCHVRWRHRSGVLGPGVDINGIYGTCSKHSVECLKHITVG